MEALQNTATIVGLLSGIVGLITAAYGLYDKFRTAGGKKTVPVAGGPYSPANPNPYMPPYPTASNPNPYMPPYPTASNPYPQQGGMLPARGAPTPGIPAPGGSYGAPVSPSPQQWGYPARPVAPPMASAYPYYAPYPAHPAARRWFTYPWILLGSAGFFILAGIYSGMTGSSSSPTDATSAIVLVLAWAVYLPTVIFAARHAIRLQRWGWLVSIIVLFGYGVLAFGLFGPTTRPGRR